MSDEHPLRRAERNGVLVLTLDRPHARNAITLRLATEIAESMRELDARTDLHVAVLAGAEGNFCAGMDLKGFARGEIPRVEGAGFAGLVARPPSKPLIAAVEGFALAGGFEIALTCDLIVASETAVFGLPEVTRGLTASGGGLLRLAQRLPFNVAMELVLTGRPMLAAEAHSMGLVNALTPPGQALGGAMELAETIATNAPLAVVAAKRVVTESGDWSLAERFDRQSPIIEPVLTSRDAKEGAQAFVQKRTAHWSGS